MGCGNVQNNGVKTRSKVQNIRVRTRSRSLKGASGVGSVEENIGKTTSREEKWTKGEVEALLDAYEYNYVESERPNHGKLQWKYCASEVNNRLGRLKNAFFRDAKQCKTKMDTLRHEYKNLKLKEGKSGSGSINWPDFLKRLNKILGSNPKIAGLDGARDGGKKTSKLGQDLNKDPPELVNEVKKKKRKDGVSKQAINKSKKDFNNGTLKPFEKTYLE